MGHSPFNSRDILEIVATTYAITPTMELIATNKRTSCKVDGDILDIGRAKRQLLYLLPCLLELGKVRSAKNFPKSIGFLQNVASFAVNFVIMVCIDCQSQGDLYKSSCLRELHCNVCHKTSLLRFSR